MQTFDLRSQEPLVTVPLSKQDLLTLLRSLKCSEERPYEEELAQKLIFAALSFPESSSNRRS